MKNLRWKVRTLVVLVIVVALGIKGGFIIRERSRDPWKRRNELYSLAREFPRPATAEATFVEALDDPDENVRAAALQGLSLIGSPRTEAVALVAIDDPSQILRDAAVRALIQVGSRSPKLILPLIAMLEAETYQSRMDNLRNETRIDPTPVLIGLKLPPAVIAPKLRKAMAGRNRLAQYRAIQILCEATKQSGPPDPTLVGLLLTALRTDGSKRPGPPDPPHSNMVLALLEDPEISIRVMIPEALARLDAATRRQTVALLIEQLQGSDRTWQLMAAIGLSHFDPEGRAAAGIIAGRLEGDKPFDRLADLYLIGRLGPVGRPAVPDIVRVMTTVDPNDHKQWGWNFLGKTLFPTPIDARSWPLGQLVSSSDRGPLPHMPIKLCVWVLGRISPEAEQDAVQILGEMLRDEDTSKWSRVTHALGEMGYKASALILTMLEMYEHSKSNKPNDFGDHGLREALENVCVRDDPRLSATLVRMMGSEDPNHRWLAANLLSRFVAPSPELVPVLIRAMKDPWQSVRFDASYGLGRFDMPEGRAAIPALIAGLDDENEWVRVHSAKSLGLLHADGGRAISMLIGMLQDEKNSTLRSHAAEALGAFGRTAIPAIPALQKAQSDPVEFVRDSVERALKVIPQKPED